MPRHGHLSVFWSLPNKIITHQHQEIIIIFSYLTSFYRRSNCLVLLRVTCPPYMEWSPYMRESGIREIFACGIRGILGFGFRNTAKEIRNPESKFYRHKIGSQFLESGILSQNPRLSCTPLCGARMGGGIIKGLEP